MLIIWWCVYAVSEFSKQKRKRKKKKSIGSLIESSFSKCSRKYILGEASVLLEQKMSNWKWGARIELATTFACTTMLLKDGEPPFSVQRTSYSTWNRSLKFWIYIYYKTNQVFLISGLSSMGFFGSLFPFTELQLSLTLPINS